MSTKISWADESWNPIVGCSKVSAGCANCYAEKMAYRLGCINPMSAYRPAISYKPMPPHWSGKTYFVESALTKPLHWRKPRKIFVCSMGDLFHESIPITHFGTDACPMGWLDKIFCEVIGWAPQHTYMILTKRPKRMREYMVKLYAGLKEFHHDKVVSPLPQVHLGVTVENQECADKRIPELLQTPALKRFLSIEPLLGQLSLTEMCKRELGTGYLSGSCLRTNPRGYNTKIDYVYIGCESGPGARLCSLDDIRYLMQQCRDAGVKIHVKQIPLHGKCNKHSNEWPPEFQVREV